MRSSAAATLPRISNSSDASGSGSRLLQELEQTPRPKAESRKPPYRLPRSARHVYAGAGKQILLPWETH